jgi:hypothetical protein
MKLEYCNMKTENEKALGFGTQNLPSQTADRVSLILLLQQYTDICNHVVLTRITHPVVKVQASCRSFVIQ